ncbi:radical SAM protein [Sphingomonas sp. HF-S4]|uniref:Radical SAM protein n=1 Tax=Sphingomonas agrestis TaxID=3080540 RepID=A0ABU3Y9K9_9SPHN|nr:radical SAM protein [Sphingomonas sp. HF-S4]MDV3457937.1 radical SAM protein [Sphingomonas sp. HF-S4]
MIDPFGRTISYLRTSLADRCNLRCVYCLPERAGFAPRNTQLSIDELERLASAFIRLGVRKIRLTGGEPLVRKGALDLIERLGRHVWQGALDELTLTTNHYPVFGARHCSPAPARG